MIAPSLPADSGRVVLGCSRPGTDRSNRTPPQRSVNRRIPSVGVDKCAFPDDCAWQENQVAGARMATSMAGLALAALVVVAASLSAVPQGHAQSFANSITTVPRPDRRGLVHP